MGWASSFVGIPFAHHDGGSDGTHCYGLVRMVYSRVLGVELEPYVFAGAPSDEDSERQVDGLFRAAMTSNEWTRVPDVTEPQPFDVLAFFNAKVWHVGVAVDRERMLHCPAGGLAIIERWRGPLWAAALRRPGAGIYRHASRV